MSKLSSLMDRLLGNEAPMHRQCKLRNAKSHFKTLKEINSAAFYSAMSAQSDLVVFAVIDKILFLDAFSHLYKRVCPSVRPSVSHELKPCKSAVFDQNYCQYQRERILWPCIRPCSSAFCVGFSFYSGHQDVIHSHEWNSVIKCQKFSLSL